MKKAVIFLFITLLIAATGWIILSSYVHGNDTADYRQVQNFYDDENIIPFDSLLNRISHQNSTEHFPYHLIAQTIPLTDYRKQKALLDHLKEASAPDNERFMSNMFVALSDSLLAVYQERLNFEDLNTLLSLTNDVKGLHYYAAADTNYQIVYDALFHYWMQFINQKLESVADKNYWSKYSFEYKYIYTVSEQYYYNPSIGLGNAEKVLDNFADNKYGYLFNRLLLRTSILQKTGLLIVISTIVLSLLFTIYTLLKSPKS